MWAWNWLEIRTFDRLFRNLRTFTSVLHKINSADFTTVRCAHVLVCMQRTCHRYCCISCDRAVRCFVPEFMSSPSATIRCRRRRAAKCVSCIQINRYSTKSSCKRPGRSVTSEQTVCRCQSRSFLLMAASTHASRRCNTACVIPFPPRSFAARLAAPPD